MNSGFPLNAQTDSKPRFGGDRTSCLDQRPDLGLGLVAFPASPWSGVLSVSEDSELDGELTEGQMDQS